MPKSTGLFCAYLVPFVIVLTTFQALNKNINTNGLFSRTSNYELTTSADTELNNKRNVLAKFFEKYNSPLKQHTDTFIEVADKYNLDYRLLPAISCVESSCGKNLIPASYNPFGWGIYGNNVIYFESYDKAIETVGEGLYKGYVAKGLTTPEKIEPIYTPPSKGSWRRAMRFFMNQMDDIAFGDTAVASK